MPDAAMGERACAYVVVKPGASLTTDDLREHLLARGLAIQKTPERLEIVEALPRTASGKVQKYLLRQQIAQIVGAAASTSYPQENADGGGRV